MCNIMLDPCITVDINIQAVCLNVNQTIEEKRESLAALD